MMVGAHVVLNCDPVLAETLVLGPTVQTRSHRRQCIPLGSYLQDEVCCLSPPLAIIMHRSTA